MSWLTKFIEIVEIVPGTLWGVILGSIFSLGAVVVSNRASDRRLRAQFEYERTLRNSDREYALRKDVYLTATEAISAGLQSVGKMADLETPTRDITADYTKKAPAISKVYIIGNEHIISAIIKLSTELGKASLQLMTERMLLDSKKHELTHLDEMIASFGRERDRMVDLMRQYNLQGLADEGLWKTICGNFEFESKRVGDALEKREKLSRELFENQLKCAKECGETIYRLNRFVVPTVIAMRNELGIPIDEKNYEQTIEKASAVGSENLTQFIDQVRTLATTQLGLAGDGPHVTPES